MLTFPLVPEEIDNLRADLQGADWTVDKVADLLGESAARALERDQLVPAQMALRGADSAAALLTRLFLLAEELTPSELARAFPSAKPEQLGLVRQGRAVVDLRPVAFEENDWWLASDLGEVQTGKPLRPEHVLGLGKATMSLMRMTVRDHVDTALDLGTGCGILALCLATHAKRVIATDISARACDFARFNAALNGADNIEVRQGSLFAPVQGLSFDLITSNPPFVITPASVRAGGLMEYRDGGMDRDHLIAQVFNQGPEYLRPGGILQMLANWEISGGPWWGRPQSWLPEGMQTWLVQRDLLDPPQYVEMWMRDSGGASASTYRDWLADFQAAGTEAIGMGFMALRKSSPAAFVAEEIVEGELPDGQTVISALDYLELPPGWQDKAIRRAPDVREERHYMPGSADPQMLFLTQGAGMARRVHVSSNTSALVGAADGDLTVRQIVEAVAALTDQDSGAVFSEIEAALPELLRARIAFLFDPA